MNPKSEASKDPDAHLNTFLGNSFQGGAVFIATGGSLDVAGVVTLERNSAVSSFCNLR